MALYNTVSPVLFLIFNRPDITEKVFEKIREAKPRRLFVAADGPRKDRLEEEILCSQTRAIIEGVDWDCEIKTLFREENLGCKYAVSSAIDWFFAQEEEGIILEDDCLPSNDFFRFCDELLQKYRDDDHISQITGCNVQLGKKWGQASYYFSHNIEVWGWASWRRVWNNYDVELDQYDASCLEESLTDIYGDKIVVQKFIEAFIDLKDGKVDTWDYQFRFINFMRKGLVAVPNVNLISNIGFRSDGTHTLNDDHIFSNLPIQNLPEDLIHPSDTTAFSTADMEVFYRDFGIKRRGWLERFLKMLKSRS